MCRCTWKADDDHDEQVYGCMYSMDVFVLFVEVWMCVCVCVCKSMCSWICGCMCMWRCTCEADDEHDEQVDGGKGPRPKQITNREGVHE